MSNICFFFYCFLYYFKLSPELFSQIFDIKFCRLYLFFSATSADFTNRTKDHHLCLDSFIFSSGVPYDASKKKRLVTGRRNIECHFHVLLLVSGPDQINVVSLVFASCPHQHGLLAYSIHTLLLIFALPLSLFLQLAWSLICQCRLYQLDHQSNRS